MIRLIVVATASIGLILFVAFIVSRLVGARTRGMSVRMQVFIALALIVGTFAFGLGVMVIDRIEARAVRLATAAAQDEATAIAGILAGQMERSGRGIADVASKLEQERRRGADLRLALIDGDGQVVFPPGASMAGDDPTTSSRLEEVPGTVVVSAPIVVGERQLGSVRVTKETVVMRRLLADFAPTVLVISLVLGAAAALAAMWIGRAIAKPIEALSSFGERVSSGERATAPPLASGRELRRLTRSIDSMRRQLEGRPFVETFAADLSHELKNPVAAIRASAEVLDEGAIDEPEQARRFVLRIREATERIERLLGDLLSLARIEARGVEDFDVIDVGKLVRSQVSALETKRARVTTTGDLRVRGDAMWLGRAIDNLVDNALIHSDDDADIEVAARRQGGSVEVTVENPGAVSKHVREQLFRRFVTTRGDRGGSGLGLAIARAVAESHRGRIELADGGPPSVAFRLTLPPAHQHVDEQLRRAAEDVIGSSESAAPEPAGSTPR